MTPHDARPMQPERRLGSVPIGRADSSARIPPLPVGASRFDETRRLRFFLTAGGLVLALLAIIGSGCWSTVRLIAACDARTSAPGCSAAEIASCELGTLIAAIVWTAATLCAAIGLTLTVRGGRR